MRVVYIDEVFLLNTLVDYLLLLSGARLAGEPLKRLRIGLAAALGGLYAALVFLPGWGFLERPLCKLVSAAAMTLVAFGGSRRLLRVTLTFFAVSAAFGGGVLALQLISGRPALLDLRTVILSAAACYVLLTAVFQRTACHGARELAPARLELEGRQCALTVLLDTGNTLTDPATGKAVLVAEGEKVSPLFPPGQQPTQRELADPVTALEHRQGSRWRLIPYRAVGISHGLLLAVRVDRARIGAQDYGAILVALSPTPLSDGGGYSGLVGV